MKEFNRTGCIPPYMFAELDRLKNSMLKKNCDLINLSIGDPDLPTPDFIIEALKYSCQDSRYHRYPPYEGTYEFRKAVADYYKRRFNVELDADKEVVALIGSKEGITHLSMALVDSGDIAIVPDPGYPIYRNSIYIAGGKPYIMHLTKENNYLPDIKNIPEDVAKNAKLMYINYPNNPTGAICDYDSLRSIVEFAGRNEIIVCNDAAYNEITFDNNNPISILSIMGSKECSVEIGTLSKSYNMTGWRIGYAVGCKHAIEKLMVIKSNTDSSQFGAVQYAASVALNNGDSFIESMKEIYRNRRDKVVELFEGLGFDIIAPKGSFYLWFKVPQGIKSMEFAEKLLSECFVMVTPGTAFGTYGEGFCRIALTADENVFKKAVERMRHSISK